MGEDGLQFVVAGIVGARIVLEGVRFDLLGLHLLPILLQGLLLAQAFRLACLLNNHVLVVLLEKKQSFFSVGKNLYKTRDKFFEFKAKWKAKFS